VNKLNEKKKKSQLVIDQITGQLKSIYMLPSSLLNEVFGQYEIPEEV